MEIQKLGAYLSVVSEPTKQRTVDPLPNIERTKTMKKIILAASAVAMMSGAAFASSANGVVSQFNEQARVITLESGQSYTVPRDVAIPAIQAGEKVSIQLNDEGDKVNAVLR
jgi:hypothetical protein